MPKTPKTTCPSCLSYHSHRRAQHAWKHAFLEQLTDAMAAKKLGTKKKQMELFKMARAEGLENPSKETFLDIHLPALVHCIKNCIAPLWMKSKSNNESLVRARELLANIDDPLAVKPRKHKFVIAETFETDHEFDDFSDDEYENPLKRYNKKWKDYFEKNWNGVQELRQTNRHYVVGLSEPSVEFEKLDRESLIECNNSGYLGPDTKFVDKMKQKDIDLDGKNFSVQNLIGYGSFSSVFLAESNGKTYALKISTEKSRAAEKILPRHDYLCTSLFKETHNGRTFYVMERLSMTLRDLTEREQVKLSMEQIMTVAAEVSQGLAHLHEHGWVLSDLKPENIMLKSVDIAEMNGTLRIDTIHCQLINLEHSIKCHKGEFVTEETNSITYRAPEAIAGLPYDNKVDSWALGLIIGELFSGRKVYEPQDCSTHEETIQLFRQIELEVTFIRLSYYPNGKSNAFLKKWWKLAHRPTSGSFYDRLSKITDDSYIQQGLKSLMKRLILADPAERITAAEVADATKEFANTRLRYVSTME